MATAREQLEGEFDRGVSWKPQNDPDAPNPLYGKGVRWSQGQTAYGAADFLTLRDDEGKLWSILVGNFKLKKDLLEGEVSAWNDAEQKFQVLETRGPVREGELVAIQYVGEEQFRNKQGILVTSPKYRVIRRDPSPQSVPATPTAETLDIEGAEAIIAAEQVAAEPAEVTDDVPW